jgi:hypothetical protein
VKLEAKLSARYTSSAWTVTGSENMASAQGTAPDAEPTADASWRPSHRDPLSVAGWLVALVALAAYWYFFGHKPTPRPGDEVARLTALIGPVKRKPVAQEIWTQARLAERLQVGDVVQTEALGAAEISFDSGNVVRVRPASVIHIGSTAESSTAAWRVQTGHINFAVGDQVTEIVTPTARTTAESNSFGDIDVDEAGATGVKVFGGRASVQTTRAQKITLLANEAVQVDAAGNAGAKLVLPPPPTLVAPPPQTRIPKDAVARLSWTPSPGGVTYRLALDYNVTQANLLLSAALDAPGLTDTSHELRGLETGRYFWRVAAVNEAGLEGAFSRTSLFAVVPPEPRPVASAPAASPPRLVLDAFEEVAPGIVHVSGHADARAVVTLNGVAVRVASDGSFGEYLSRGDAAELVVRATVPGGAFSEQSRPLTPR